MSVLYLHTSSPINCLTGENYWVLTEDFVHLYLTNLIITSVQPGNGLLFSLHGSRRILTYLPSGVRQLGVWVQCRSPVIQTKFGKRHCLVSLTFSVTEIWRGREPVFEFSPSADTDSQYSIPKAEFRALLRRLTKVDTQDWIAAENFFAACF